MSGLSIKCLLLFSFMLTWMQILSTDLQAANHQLSILVLPFAINARPDLQYLEQDLPNLLRDELQTLGLDTFSEELTQKLLTQQGVKTLNLQVASDLGVLAGTNFAVYGSFTQIDQNISLDVRVVKTFHPEQSQAIFVNKQGLINLLPAIKELAKKINVLVHKKETIAQILVKGNQTLDKDMVLMRLGLRKGQAYDPDKMNQALKKLYASGYFDDIKIMVQDTPQGKVVTIQVKEKPLIKTITVNGNKKLDNGDILEVMSTKTGSVINPKIIKEDLDKIRELYRKKGYYNAQVTYNTQKIAPGKAKLTVEIKEGKKLYIKKIIIKGAKQLDPDKLKKQLALSERGLFSWLTGSGVLKEELLDRDAAALEAYYANRGFFDVRVGQPKVEFKKDGIYITFQVVEGPRYKVGQVKLKGDIIVNLKKLEEQISIDDLAAKGKYFNRSILREDSQHLADFYTNFGYAFADAEVKLDKDQKKQVINVTYTLHKNQKVYIRRVTVLGNTKTRENVIRRSLALADGDLFSGAALSYSKQMLDKLDYFEQVNIQTLPTPAKDQMDLQVKVKEKSTGSFSAGAGYSSVERVFFTGQVQERNLFGRGYGASFKGSFSGTTSLFQVSFWNPHLFDGPLGTGLDAYNSDYEYDDYDLNMKGGKIKFAYTVGRFTRLYWNYELTHYIVSNVVDTASDEIKDIEGTNWSSSLYVALSRDSTNKRINPDRGTKNTISMEYAGGLLGGDDNFIKTMYDFSIYHSLFWKFTFGQHFELGYLLENSSEQVPDFERFYLGGINTVRGYKYHDITSYDSEGNEVGGYKSFFSNSEIVFPMKEDMGLLGVVFFDAGNVWDKGKIDTYKLYKSIGCGIRWNSPMGPIRLEYGYPLDNLKNNSGRFEFTMGQFF